MSSIGNNLQEVKRRLASACIAAGRAPDAVALLAVSKTQGADAVRCAHAAGQRAFGENYVQEGLEKIALLPGLALEWHLIGPLQSNKTRAVAEAFDWVHSIDRLKTAQRLADQRPPGRPPLQLCIQVNVSGEASKSGCTPDALPALAQAVAALPADHVRLRGLMAIPEPGSGAAPFRSLRAMFEQLQHQGLALDTLSMGMSDDLELAVAEGSTLVRIGTAIFGSRKP
jgi:PLP dependent protein